MAGPRHQPASIGGPPSAAHRRLLYIAGYGRSGSTVLDIALSCHPQVEGLGEMSGVFEAMTGPPDRLSPFWRDVAASTMAVPTGRSAVDLGRAATIVARAERLLPGRALLPWSRLRARYRRIQATILAELFQRTGASVLVDSSKSSWLHTWRLPLLATVVPEVHCLIVVRDLGGVVRSVRRGHGESLEPQRLPTLRAVIGWTMATVTAVIVARLACGRDRTRLVRHERFVADPGGHLVAAFDRLGLEVDRAAVAAAVTTGFRPGHQLLGNRVRGEEVVRIRPLPAQGGSLPGPAELAVAIASRLVEALALRQVPELMPAPSDGSFEPPAGYR